jgi:hypothetical protein
MEPELWSVDSVAALEAEVEAAEQRLASLTASIRAVTVEMKASDDPAQFDLRRPHGQEDPVIALIFGGFFFGAAVGGGLLKILSLIVHGQGQ